MNILNWYRSKIERIKTMVEFSFEICLYVVVFMGHKTENFQVTRGYKIFAVLMIVLGLWLYIIKKQKYKDMFFELIGKFSIPFIGALIIGKLTSKIDVSDIVPVLYLIPIGVMYYLQTKKISYKVGGKIKQMSSYEYLKVKIGEYALIPEISMYITIIVVAIFNGTYKELVISFMATIFLFNPLYIFIVDKIINR